jgi:hypothetical protein
VEKSNLMPGAAWRRFFATMPLHNAATVISVFCIGTFRACFNGTFRMMAKVSSNSTHSETAKDAERQEAAARGTFRVLTFF